MSTAPAGPPPVRLEPTPLPWRVAIAAGVLLLAAAAYLLQRPLGPRGVAFVGVLCFLGVLCI